jgi:ABC-type multidrug transport system permease subunit
MIATLSSETLNNVKPPISFTVVALLWMLLMIVLVIVLIYFFFIIPNRSRQIIEAERFHVATARVSPEDKI